MIGCKLTSKLDWIGSMSSWIGLHWVRRNGPMSKSGIITVLQIRRAPVQQAQPFFDGGVVVRRAGQVAHGGFIKPHSDADGKNVDAVIKQIKRFVVRSFVVEVVVIRCNNNHLKHKTCSRWTSRCNVGIIGLIHQSIYLNQTTMVHTRS